MCIKKVVKRKGKAEKGQERSLLYTDILNIKNSSFDSRTLTSINVVVSEILLYLYYHRSIIYIYILCPESPNCYVYDMLIRQLHISKDAPSCFA